MVVSSAILSRRLAGSSCSRLWCSVPQPLVHIRSASSAEQGARKSDEEHLWEAGSDATGYLPFSRARVGSFFQDQPILKNPFLEDAILRGYLTRHLPQEVF